MSIVPDLDRLLALSSSLYTLHIAPFLPSPLAKLISTAGNLLGSFVLPVLRGGDLPSIAALLVILYLSVRTLDYIRRSVLGWVLFAVKLLLLAAVVQGVWYVNLVGWERALDGAGWMGGLVWGWVEGLWEGGDVGGQGGPGGYGAAGKREWNRSGGRQQQQQQQQAWGTGAGRGGGNRWT